MTHHEKKAKKKKEKEAPGHTVMQYHRAIRSNDTLGVLDGLGSETTANEIQ